MNTALASWMGQVASICIVSSIVSATWEVIMNPNGAVPKRIKAYEDELNKKIKFLRIQFSGRQVFIAQMTMLVLLGLLLFLASNPLLLIPIPAVMFLPRIVLQQFMDKRVTGIEEQLDTWLTALANALTASTSLGEALASSNALIRPPLSQEVDLLLKEYRLGTPLDNGMDKMAKRIGSRTVASALLVLRIARNTGGNLAETLRSSAASLRELARLESVARTKTAEGKAQAVVVGLIPFPLFGTIHLMDPIFLSPLFESFKGHFILVVAVALWLTAIAVARRVLAVDI